MEEIFEAEDSLPPDADLDALAKDWFSTHTIEAARPLLAQGVIRKLTKLTSQIARPCKRMRIARDTPRKQSAGTLSEMDPSMLGRVLKILERSIKAGEDVEPFGSAERKASPAKGPAAGTKKAKGGKGRKSKGKESAKEREDHTSGVRSRTRSRSRTPKQDARTVDQDAMDAEEDGGDLTGQDFRKLEKALEVAKESVLAADCCIALLAADKLSKQVGRLPINRMFTC